MVRYVVFIVLLFSSATVFSQYSLSGKIITSKRQTPVAFASVSIPALELWATANDKGAFTLKNIPAGKIAINVEYLGYERKVYEMEVTGNVDSLVITIDEKNLLLNEVIVTARKKESSFSTSYVMDRTALDHMQMLNVTDVTSLLPGGKTNSTQHLATSATQTFSVNGTSGEMGNAVFGVAVEVDGVRLSNSALPGLVGSDTRNIASSNVESVEIITGIPSVEYGDMTNGMVKINTRKGKSPFVVEMMTKPNTKQVTLGKGVELGPRAGVLNVNLEYTKSISNIASPYTSYDRNTLALNYSNTFNKKNRQPLLLDIGLTGNVGGYDTKADPDQFKNTYTKLKDNVLRGSFSLKWLLHKKWITNVELSGSVNYNNRLQEQSSNASASSSVAAIHATEEGYHVGQLYDTNPQADIILIQPGYWYQVAYNDSKVLNYTGRIKANWNRKLRGNINNNLLVGGEYSVSGNNGRGSYYDDMRYAPTWREYRYDNISKQYNYALYAEDRVYIPLKRSAIRVVGGLRSDITAINGSVYGTINNISPRFNGEYIFWEKAKQKVRDLSVKIGWGKTVKLPGFSVLYPQTNYRDLLTFAPGTTADGQTYYAYYTIPSKMVYNPDLKWQYNIQKEISLNTNIKGTRISITAAIDKTYNSYVSSNDYTPFTYKFTDQSNLEHSLIPAANRIYTVDKNTGVVTVTDKTGTLPAEQLSYREITRAISNSTAVNGSSVLRKRLSWIIDFKQVTSIRTAFRVDGNYYYYKGVEQTVSAYMPNSTITMADGNPYKYIGFFTGGANSANGSLTKGLNMNVTSTTHIPSIRLIISARLECSLYNFSRNLSEQGSGQRGFVLDSKDDYTPSSSKTDIYGKDRFVGLYPDYYISFDDMNTRIPFADKFLWAKTNDPALYNELAKMVIKTNYNYYFNPNRVSVYYSANIGVTKEIGRVASVTFNATNFINNLAKVRSTWNDGASSLFGSSYVPAFYYGLSLRLKL
ncbi:MAG: TonB-dependent receptor [Chitinophagaceae bacterium]